MNAIRLKLAGLAFAAGIATTAATLVAVAAPALAASPKTLERVVFHRDLDLATPAGKRTLDARIKRIATRFCMDPRAPSPAARLAARPCVAAVIASAVPTAQREIARDVAAASATRAAALQP